MRFALSVALILSTFSSGAQAFSIGKPSTRKNGGIVIETRLFGTAASSSVTTAVPDETKTVVEDSEVDNDDVATRNRPTDALASAEVKARLDAQLAKLKLKDSTSTKLSKEVSA